MVFLFDKFDQVRIVNLPQRRDRRRAMEREFSKVGLSSERYEFFSAIKPVHKGDFTSVGARGCYESHLSILREAKAAQHSVLIVEDDCVFDINAASDIFSGDWKILYGGYYPADPENLHQSDIIGSHMMGFSQEGVSIIADYLGNLSYEGIHPPIDAAYVWFRRANPHVRTNFAVPPLARQRRSRSDVADLKLYDRLPIVKNAVNAIRAWRD